MGPIARLTPVPLRELWKHEALDFTSWLAENLDYLEEATGLTLSLVEQEASAGDFSADILAEDNSGNTVVIENQLEKTDHDHLGKLLTYMSNLDAKTAIWISSQPRPEHEKAVHWLNETLPADTAFYLIQVEAYRIADSPPAPKFTVIAGPSEESRRIGTQRKELAERYQLRLEFWEQLLEKANQRAPQHPHARISPNKDNWIGAGAGKSGLAWAHVILMDHARVEFYIDTQDGVRNKKIFDFLAQRKEEIEKAFGASLDWQRLEGKRAARICHYLRNHGGLRNRDKWDELQDAMIDAMIRLEKAIKPYIKKLP